MVKQHKGPVTESRDLHARGLLVIIAFMPQDHRQMRKEISLMDYPAVLDANVAFSTLHLVKDIK